MAEMHYTAITMMATERDKLFKVKAMAEMKYIAIAPARDEEAHLPQLIDAMEGQTVKPARWVIINDGSTDRTAEIADRAASRCDWIEIHHLPHGRPRQPGGESVVMHFLSRPVWSNVHAILRVDADVSFGPAFAEQLLFEFEREPDLGIVGPTLLEPTSSGWRRVKIPSFHANGAAKMYRAACFEAIGGLDPGLGWDTLDEIRATMAGYRTRSLPHVRAFHHRPQGSARGLIRGRFLTGQAAYNVGYSFAFMLARAAANLLEPPPVVGSLSLLAGFLAGYLRRQPRTAPQDVVSFIRRHQRRRLLMMDSIWR